MTTQNTLTLVMIVKNESKIIRRCLESVEKIIDYIVISDTGSTDNTIEIINDFMKEKNIKGKVYQNEWKNFGHNRTLSIKNCEDFLTINNINMSTNYQLHIDADMRLKIEPSFDKNDLSQADTFMLRQCTDVLVYYNVRIFRSDMQYICIGVTHEYNSSPLPSKSIKYEKMYIDDVGDGGAKEDKFERDIRLLTQGIIDEPDNFRYYFYLAQSYADINNYDEAIKWYNKRIDAGNWLEEIFISHLRLGEIYIKLNNSAKAIFHWMEGYNALPSRSETLYRIIRYYRYLGKNHAAYSFLITALRIKFPDLLLFIEHQIYNYRLFEELVITGFYCGEKPKYTGFMASQYLIFNKVNEIPRELKEFSTINSFYYIQSLKFFNHIVLNITSLEKDYINSSSSLFNSKAGTIKGLVRAVNYSIGDQFNYTIRDPNSVVRTKNYMVEIDKNKRMNSITEITCSVKPKRISHISGMEDMRLVYLGTECYSIACCWEYSKHNIPSVCLVHINTKNNKFDIDRVMAIKYKEDECQKNWVPFIYNKKICVIYSHNPLTILELNENTGDAKVLVEKECHYDMSSLRGSSSPIKLQDNSWIMICHEVMQRETRKYYHRIVRYDKDWNLVGMSLPFYFKNFFVEFCTSIMVNENILTACYSTRDNTTELISIKLEDVPMIPMDEQGWYNFFSTCM